VLGTGNDYLFVPTDERLYVLMQPTSVIVLIAISILTVYMTVILAHNLETTVRAVDTSPHVSGINVPICMTALLVLSLFSDGHWNTFDRFVTMEDECALVVLVIYNVYHVSQMVLRIALDQSSTQKNTINSILGTMALVSLCYYHTMDNPYSIIITIIMASRLVYKLNSSLQEEHVVYADDVVGDSVMISILAYTGIIPQFNYDPVVLGLYGFQGVYLLISNIYS
jgi:hypothetical protein